MGSLGVFGSEIVAAEAGAVGASASGHADPGVEADVAGFQADVAGFQAEHDKVVSKMMATIEDENERMKAEDLLKQMQAKSGTPAGITPLVTRFMPRVVAGEHLQNQGSVTYILGLFKLKILPLPFCPLPGWLQAVDTPPLGVQIQSSFPIP